MKKIFILFFLSFKQSCFATDWSWFYVYVQTSYPQGPWSRTNVLNEYGYYKYLQPKLHEELFGSEPISLAQAIFNNLKTESESKTLYKQSFLLSVVTDTVFIECKNKIVKFDSIKNEILASFLLNSFKAVKVIQPDSSNIYVLKDISIPYMDLVYLPNKTLRDSTNSKDRTNNIITKDLSVANTEENKISIWLIISLIANFVLLVMLFVRKKKTD
jgi:hypothetical protein